MRLIVSGITAVLVALGLMALPAQAVSNYSVATVLSATSVTANHSVKLSGIVGPTAKGKKVTLQRKTTGSYKTVASKTLTSASTFSFTIKEKKRGLYTYRVVKAAGSGLGSGSSAPVVLLVGRWSSLTDRTPFAPLGYPVGSEVSSIKMLGRSYAKSVTNFQGSALGYHLNGRCSKLEVYLGANDNLGAGGDVVVESTPVDPGGVGKVLAGLTVNQGSFPFFVTDYTNISATKDLIFRASGTYSTGTNGGGLAVFGSPQAFCIF